MKELIVTLGIVVVLVFSVLVAALFIAHARIRHLREIADARGRRCDLARGAVFFALKRLDATPWHVPSERDAAMRSIRQTLTDAR